MVAKINSTLDKMLEIVSSQERDVKNFRNLLVDVDALALHIIDSDMKGISLRDVGSEKLKWTEKMRHIFTYKSLLDNWCKNVQNLEEALSKFLSFMVDFGQYEESNKRITSFNHDRM